VSAIAAATPTASRFLVNMSVPLLVVHGPETVRQAPDAGRCEV